MSSQLCRLLVVLVIAGWTATAAPARADCPGAEAFIQDAADRTLAILNAPGATDQQRLDGMSKLLFEVADIPLIARIVLGRHWRSATEEQRADYLDAFRVYALDSLAYRFARLGGEVGLRLLGRCVEDGKDALVATEASLPNRPQPVRIDWRVRDESGDYRLIDVAIEGVSMVVSNRSEFDSVIGRQGLDGLIAQIRGKSAERS
jgi:phospholipid transport system substrate-binding protein